MIVLYLIRYSWRLMPFGHDQGITPTHVREDITALHHASDSSLPSCLAATERQLRALLPVDLYARVWVDPSPTNLMRVFEHLRTLHYILHDYTPRQVSTHPPLPGHPCYTWQEGTLLFTDLAGFTSLLEANASYGQRGARVLLEVLNRYFSEMIEIISKSGGDLLEFTGDAMLVQFLAEPQGYDVAQAVRAGLRMQRAMAQFTAIATIQGKFSLQMRVGIHTGQFLTANIGTPMRMAHVLLGHPVQSAKRAEGAGKVGRVCLTQAASDRLMGQFQLEPMQPGYFLVVDHLTAEQLGEYDLALTRRRSASTLLLDRSVAGLISEIEQTVNRVEPLASYLPTPLLTLLVENAAQRQIPPNFPSPVVMFVNLSGLTRAMDGAIADDVDHVIRWFSQAFALINAAVRSRGGILQKVTYHDIGSDFLLYFGVMAARSDDAIRAADAALAIHAIVQQLNPLQISDDAITIQCRIGITQGAVFAAEIGEPRGRREFNILGDPVNTAARLMSQAMPDQVLMTKAVYGAIAHQFQCDFLGEIPLKGKAIAVPIFQLQGRLEAISEP